MQTNRAIVLTAPGVAAIAVVRLLGPGVDAFLQAHFSKPMGKGRCVHGELRDGARVIDDPVVVLCENEVADLNVHGGIRVVQSVLELASRFGFEVIKPVDLPRPLDAVDGPTTLWREVLAYLPLARTELAVRALLAQPGAWENFKQMDMDGKQAQAILADRSLHWLLSLPQVAIVGPSNVGKSTLANRLFGQERSIVADMPGTTRDWVGEVANIDGLAVLLMDTPGVRETADDIEHRAILASGARVEAADLVIVVLDASVPMDSTGWQLIQKYPGAVVANKVDRMPAWDRDEFNAMGTVATSGEGVDRVRSVILRHFGCEKFEMDKPRVWTARQREIIPANDRAHWVRMVIG